MPKHPSVRSGFTFLELLIIVSVVAILIVCGVMAFRYQLAGPSETREVTALLKQGQLRPLTDSELSKAAAMLEEVKNKADRSDARLHRDILDLNQVIANRYFSNFRNSASTLPEPQKTLAAAEPFGENAPTPQAVKEYYKDWVDRLNQKAAALADFKAHPESYTLSLKSPTTVALLRRHETDFRGQKISGTFEIFVLNIEDARRLLN